MSNKHRLSSPLIGYSLVGNIKCDIKQASRKVGYSEYRKRGTKKKPGSPTAIAPMRCRERVGKRKNVGPRRQSNP